MRFYRVGFAVDGEQMGFDWYTRTEVLSALNRHASHPDNG